MRCSRSLRRGDVEEHPDRSFVDPPPDRSRARAARTRTPIRPCAGRAARTRTRAPAPWRRSTAARCSPTPRDPRRTRAWASRRARRGCSRASRRTSRCTSGSRQSRTSASPSDTASKISRCSPSASDNSCSLALSSVMSVAVPVTPTIAPRALRSGVALRLSTTSPPLRLRCTVSKCDAVPSFMHAREHRRRALPIGLGLRVDEPLGRACPPARSRRSGASPAGSR